MTPQEALAYLGKLADDSADNPPATRGLVPATTIRRVVDDVEQHPEGLIITEAEAGVLLALINGRPVPPEAVTGLIEAITGRLQVITE